MPDIFKDILPSIYNTKEDVFVDGDYKDYNPFLVNRALSYHRDCVLYANVMNQYPGLDKKSQYAFYLSSIRKGKRPFVKWEKPHTSHVVEALKTLYGYSDQKARQVFNILTTEQKDLILQLVDKGGTKK